VVRKAKPNGKRFEKSKNKMTGGGAGEYQPMSNEPRKKTRI
jgi:hypothetical protein